MKSIISYAHTLTGVAAGSLGAGLFSDYAEARKAGYHRPHIRIEDIVTKPYHENITYQEVQSDAKSLRDLGYDINAKELFYMARLVSDEAGLFYTPKKGNKKELELTKDNKRRMHHDMEGIVHNILNRYLVAMNDLDGRGVIRGSFSGRNVSFYNIMFREKQYSAAEVKLWKRSWDNAYIKKDLAYNEPRLTKEKATPNLRKLNQEKIIIAYKTSVSTLRKIAKNPGYDPTNGSLFYKRAEWPVKWAGKKFGGYSKVHLVELGQHNHYGLVDPKGKLNPRSHFKFNKKNRKA